MTSSTSRRRLRTSAAALLVGATVVTATCVAMTPVAGTSSAEAATTSGAITATAVWGHTFGISGQPVALASPMVASVDSSGAPVVLIGDRAGYERAFRLQGGATVGGWPVHTGVAIDSTPSVIGTKSAVEIIFGEGNSGAPSLGGIRALNGVGKTLWYVKPKATPAGGTAGVMSSVSVGNQGGTKTLVAGAMGQEQYQLSTGGATEPGFPWFEADTNFTTPALADPLKKNHDEIIEGGDSTAGNAFNVQYSNGGHIRILNYTGNAGTGSPSGGLRCQYNTTQVVQSSPAVGHFLGNSQFGIIAGTGSFYKGASDSNKLIAINNNCGLVWKASLTGNTVSSPALANITGTGQLFALQGTSDSQTVGHIYAINAGTGKTLWVRQLPGQVLGSPVAADLMGNGVKDVVVATTNGAFILDGRNGTILNSTIGKGYGFQNSPLITKDPNGATGITLAGYNGANQGMILHYTIAGSSGSKVNETGAWPMFHHDQRLTGNADVPLTTP